MNNALKVFQNEQFGQVRVIEKDGEPWFVARDVALALKYRADSKMGMLLKHIPEEWKGVNQIYTPGGYQDMACLSEQGVYFFLARSDKPKALPFQKWLAGDVVPTIVKHGMYATPQTVEDMLNDPDTTIRILTALKEEREQRKALESKVEEDKPKVLFADSVATAQNSILVGDLAKIICQNGVDIGQNRLFEWLRKNGYLISKRGNSFNSPTQRAMDMKLFEVKERTVNNPDGSIRTTLTTKVTGKGQIYFVNMFVNGKSCKVGSIETH